VSKKLGLVSAVLLLAFTALFGCTANKTNDTASSSPSPTASGSPSPSASGSPSPSAAKASGQFKEAPMLADLVKAGTIPVVDQRLPVKSDIMVEPVVKSTGKYGGDWSMNWRGPDDKWGPEMITEEPLFRFKQDGSGVEPNVAKSYDVNANSTEYIIHLRQGMKWSDGVPFTADDVIFYWEHMLVPETFGKALYDCYYSIDPATGAKERADVTKVDDYSVKVTFKHPSVQFLQRLAIDNKWFFAPAHYYKTVLPEFIGDAKALEVAKQYGFADLKTLGKETGYYYWLYPQRPTLRPWVAKNDANSDKFIMERNPYFFKTDSKGQQLPYIDRLVYNKVQDNSNTLLDTLAGNVVVNGADFKDFTVLKENETKGNYKVLQWKTPNWSSTGIQLNQTTEDPKLRALFQDIRFRQAISIAVDRKQVSEIVTSGMGVPSQASVPQGLPYYQDGWDKQWTQYDKAGAEKLLDQIGLKWDANHKYRTFADGSNLSLLMYENKGGDDEKFIELVRKYFDEIGLKSELKVVDGGAYGDLTYANKIPVSFKNVSVMDVALRPDELVPLRVITPWFGLYGLYTSSGGKEGVKPTGDVAKVLEDWDKLKAATSNEEIKKWANEIVKLHMKNQWIIGYTSATPPLLVVKNNVKNVPEGLVSADEFRGTGVAHAEQFYIE
jgi:peptide/nickel transport system substrate-binding protein